MSLKRTFFGKTGDVVIHQPLESINRVRNLTQAYSQAPWRRQVQYIGWFLSLLVVAALIAGIYLSVTARTATVGREIQVMHDEIKLKEREIEDQLTELALLTSNTEMQKRAGTLGFQPVTSDQIQYIQVPGYRHPRQVVLANPPANQVPSAPSLSPEYTQSLFEWLRERIFEPAAPLLREVRP